MIADGIREKLQDIVRGARLERQGDHCTTIRNLLVESFGANPTVKREFESRAILKEEQASFLKNYANETGLWLHSPPDTSEYLTRGGENAGSLCAILQQPYVEGGQADLEAIRQLLTFNGFKNTKRQDYYNQEFELVLEDMHDENVIAKGNILFFIDTVFYVMG